MFIFKQKFVCREQNFVLNNKYDKLSSFLHWNCYLKVICTVLFKLFTLYFCFNFVDKLIKDLTSQQIVSKIQSFHVPNDKKLQKKYLLPSSAYFKYILICCLTL